jgi:hypothetical protein
VASVATCRERFWIYPIARVIGGALGLTTAGALSCAEQIVAPEDRDHYTKNSAPALFIIAQDFLEQRSNLGRQPLQTEARKARDLSSLNPRLPLQRGAGSKTIRSLPHVVQ